MPLGVPEDRRPGRGDVPDVDQTDPGIAEDPVEVLSGLGEELVLLGAELYRTFRSALGRSVASLPATGHDTEG
ncbi:hypothetical protein AB0B86_10930 [Micromonospora sp. NPDC049047]|uniref:hypothetical protein n=1 Tax=Micromonospora sp. NPDC049047 TaxID=3155645 RepID=UPI0033C22134